MWFDCAAVSDSSPRHLAPTGRGKPAWSRRWLIAGGGVVVLAVTATAIALTRHGDDELLSGLSQLPTTPSVATTAPPATSVPPTTSPPATSAPPTTGAPRPVQPTPGNLLANGDFERGLAGWEPVGGRIDRVGIGHSGRWSLRLRDGGTPSPSGGAAGEPVARSTQTVQGQAGESYEASAWVRATRPGTEAILKLRELGGAGESADTIGVTLVDADWHEVAVIHQAHAGGGRLTVEAAAGNLQPGDGLLLDQISLTRSDEN
jgi:hypothetical protein